MTEPASQQDESSLDNPAYAALSSTHSRFAQRSGNALRYPADVAPFVAIPSGPSRADWRNAARLLAPGTAAGIIHDGSPPPRTLKSAQAFEVVQMIEQRASHADDPEAILLGAGDVPEMLELVRRTNPGPFLQRTIELGTYIGFRRDGELVAMAGERLRFDGWTEISAVCTAPGHRGHGLASRLVSALVAGVRRRSERAFLHALSSNTEAIRVYERLGFRVRRTGTITVVEPA